MPHGEQLSASDERCPSRPHDRGGDAILGQLRLEPLEDPDGLRAHAKHAQPHQHKETKAPRPPPAEAYATARRAAQPLTSPTSRTCASQDRVTHAPAQVPTVRGPHAQLADVPRRRCSNGINPSGLRRQPEYL